MKKSILGTVAVLTTVLLAGCAPSPRQPVETTAAPTAPSSPTLRVPETATGSSVQLEVHGGNLPKGTPATIYRFDGGWSGETPTCDDPNVETRDATLIGGSEYQVIPFPVITGVEHWVLVAGDFTTPCGDPNAATTVLVETALDTYVSGISQGGTKDDRLPVGEPRQIEVKDKSVGEITVPMPVTVTISGPWKTVPEAKAADCAKATAAVSIDLKIEHSESNPDSATTEFTPSQPGVYKVAVTADETGQTTAFDGCAAEKAVMFVAAE